MRIILFETIGELGIVTEWNRVIHDDYLIFEVDREGELIIGERKYAVCDGRACVPQYHVVLGEPRRITFADKQGKRYFCGVISRTGGHLINIAQETDVCLIACVEQIANLKKEILDLKEENKKIKNEYGVSFE